MSLLAALQDLAERLGLDPAPHHTADGRPRWVFLLIAGLVSLGLWFGIGWVLVKLAEWLLA